MNIHKGLFDAVEGQEWIVEDPIAGSHFSIGDQELEFLSLLKSEKSAIEACLKLKKCYPEVQVNALISFIEHLKNHGLLVGHEVKVNDRKGISKAALIFQKLIYFRISLFRPDDFLNSTVSLMRWLGAPWFRALCNFVLLGGLLFLIRDFERYVSTSQYLLTPLGSFLFILTFMCVKAGHELAHAYVTKSLGCHVRSMGVAFILGWPILYTDVTDAWKCPDKKSRMAIDCAGVLFELYLAGFALVLWQFTDPGIFQSLLFYLSCVSILISFLVNLNPFMKFDGYYLLMDAWGIPNLQARSFALLKNKLRKVFLGWKGVCPENHHQFKMVIYAIGTFVYRCFVLFAICVALYQLSFQVLGILLFIFAVTLFFIFPIRNEILYILKNRSLIGSWKKWGLSLSLLVVGLALLCYPFNRQQCFPAVSILSDIQVMRSKGEGRMVTGLPEIGDVIKKGQLVVQMSNESLDVQKHMIELDIKLTELKISTLSTSGTEGAYRNALIAENKRLLEKVKEIQKKSELLQFRSLFDGVVVQVNAHLKKGVILGERTYICTVANPEKKKIKVYIREQDQQNVEGLVNARASFLTPNRKNITLKFLRKNQYPGQQIDGIGLLDVHGGLIESRWEDQQLKATENWIEVLYEPLEPLSFARHGLSCEVYLSTGEKSVMTSAIQPIWNSLSREGLL